MWLLPASVRLLACTEPADLRRSFSGLSLLVRSLMHQDPLDGHIYIFFNKTADQVRLLYFERGGYCIWAKRLEAGRFKVPWKDKFSGATWQLSPVDLALILEGIDLAGSRRSKRWQPISATGDNRV